MADSELFPVALATGDESARYAEALLKRIELSAHEARVLVAQGRRREAVFALRKVDGWAHEVRVLLRESGGEL